MYDTSFTDALNQLLQDKCMPTTVRDIEADTTKSAHQPLWQAIESSGFADAMRTEKQGGANLSLSDAFPLFMLFGQHCLPIPLAQTMLARGWLDEKNIPVPIGSIALANGSINAAGDLVCSNIASGRICDWVLVALQDAENFSFLLPIHNAIRTPAVFPTDCSLIWSKQLLANKNRLPAIDAKLYLACIYATQLAGTLVAVFERTLQFANDRQQFGKPIGKFQAIQHQLSVMAEQVFAARMAAQIGSYSKSITPNLHRVAIAKARTSEAAVEVAALSHSIHGAIGFTAEFDLQLLTRRLHLWRQAAGSESYWHSVLGQALLEQDGLALDLIRNTTDIH
jgi:acyl-CoA dehydrogenase